MIARTLVGFAVLLGCAAAAPAQEPAWKAVLGDFLKTEKTGPFGLCGIAVDRKTGDVFVNLSDRGLYVSPAGGGTFVRTGDPQPKGRTESPGCMLVDPTGKSKAIVAAFVYGSPISVTLDRGKTWRSLDGKSSHVDWCAVDWSDLDGGFVLALKHEAGGLLLASRDGGKAFEPIGKGYGTGWVFDSKTAVVAQAKSKDRPAPNLMRTTDAGKTWEPCGRYSPVGSSSAQALPRWFEGSLYWLTDEGLIVSSDQGASWQVRGPAKNARFGPVFGRDAKHLFILAGGAVAESVDGGASWTKQILLPPPLRSGGLAWLDYDPNSDTLYAMKMASDLFVLQRK